MTALTAFKSRANRRSTSWASAANARTAIAAHVSSCSAARRRSNNPQLLLGQLDATYHKEDQLRRLSLVSTRKAWKNRHAPVAERC